MKGEGHPSLAQPLYDLAELYREQGRYAEAEPIYQETLSILNFHFGETLDVAATLHSLGILSYSLGRDSEAERYYLESLEIVNKGFDIVESIGIVGSAGSLGSKLEENYSIVSNSLGQLYVQQRRYQQATALYEDSLTRIKSAFGDNHIGIASISNSLGQVHLLQNNFTDAEQRFETALTVLGDEHSATPVVLNNIGEAYRVQGQHQKAIEFYDESISKFTDLYGDGHPSISRVVNNIGLSYYAQKDYEKAAESFLSGVQIEQDNLAHNLIAGSESQKRDYINTFSGTTHAVVSLHLQALPNDVDMTQFAFNTILQRKGRILDVWANSLQAACQEIEPEDRATCDEYKQVISRRSNLEYLQQEDLASTKSYQEQLAELENAITALEDQISRASSEFRTATEAITSADIQALLPSNSALVEIVRYRPLHFETLKDSEGIESNQTLTTTRPDTTIPFAQLQRFGPPRYAAYLLGSDGTVQGIDIGSAEAIDTAVSNLSTNVSSPDTPIAQVKESAQALDTLVMAPVRKALGGTKTVYLAPDGALNLIPFEVLVDESGEYLAKDYQFRYLTSGRDLVRLANSSASTNSATLMGNPSYDKTEEIVTQTRTINFIDRIFPALPGTQDEVDLIAAKLPASEVHTQTNATEAVIKQQVQPSILHIATHGFFEPIDDIGNPLLRSGLVLAGVTDGQSGPAQDGILTALEVTGLSLRGTQLVVLSACETGLGELSTGEGLYGLRRSLVLAGSQSQVISLWKVDDTATQKLMVDYYDRLLSDTPRDAALLETQLAFIESGEYSHPYYWAAFISSGDWRTLQQW